jgi:rubredoxin
MEKWECLVCGHIYDEDEGDPESAVLQGTALAELPDDWACPVCGSPKEQFEEIS